MFDLKRRIASFANSGLPYPIHVTGSTVSQIDLPGVPLGSFPTSTYDELTVELELNHVFVFCSDGISETFNIAGEEFSSLGIMDVAQANRDKPAKEIVAAIFGAMQAFRGDAPQTDDQTVVVVKITA